MRHSREREVRYLLMGIHERFDAHRKNYLGRTYIETPLPLRVPGNVREILIGPNAPREAEAMVADFLRNQSYTDSIPTIRSKVVL